MSGEESRTGVCKDCLNAVNSAKLEKFVKKQLEYISVVRFA
jgi:hypothetical protein